jgi:hypothetical protein
MFNVLNAWRQEAAKLSPGKSQLDEYLHGNWADLLHVTIVEK